MNYDIFLSYAWEDREIAQQIVMRLEHEENHVPRGGYKVCIHERDFMPGMFITENIQQAIESSKRVVCLLSHNFIRSYWCMMEFRAAWSHCKKLKKRRLIVVKWPEIDDLLATGTDAANQSDTNECDLRLFLSTHTYVEYSPGSSDWWHQLIYALPRQSLPRLDEAISDQVEPRENDLNEAWSTDNLLV
jgi:protein toll